MAKIVKRVGFTIEVDEDTIAPMSVNVFLYRLFNNLNNENPITSITVDDVTVDVTEKDALYNLPLGEDKPLQEAEVQVKTKQ